VHSARILGDACENFQNYCIDGIELNIAHGTGMSMDDELRWHWLAGVVAAHLWDDDRWHLLSDRHVRLARGVGALSELPLALSSLAARVI
jgi:hypothetical protein